MALQMVVFPFSSTSNHNLLALAGGTEEVVFPFSSTSNHNPLLLFVIKIMLYFLSLLHQTTTFIVILFIFVCCISFLFYIKPQLMEHLLFFVRGCISFLFYIKPQRRTGKSNFLPVVFPFSSTSNHNRLGTRVLSVKLYFLSLLHQTTTVTKQHHLQSRCISFLFYIKPQHVLSKRLELSPIWCVFTTRSGFIDVKV